jgi:hypothetical protein
MIILSQIYPESIPNLLVMMLGIEKNPLAFA